MISSDSRQTGSAFFIILIAIVLFAALAYALTQGSSTNESNLTDSQAKIAARDIVNYGDSLAQTFQKLRLRGCAENEFDFSNAVWVRADGSVIHAAGDNPSAATGCGFFTDGKAIPVTFPRNYFADITLSSGQINFGSGYIGTSKLPGIGVSTLGDVYYIIPHLSKTVCMKINDILGIENPSGAPPSITAASYPVYKAAFNNGVVLTDSSGGKITGKYAYCFNNPAEGTAHRFIQVLLQR